MENLNEIKEINQHISDALEQWSDIMITADADNWAYYLNYEKKDALNAVFIANHVLQNIAIKSGYIKDEEDAFKKGTVFRQAILDFCGLDMQEVTREQLSIKNKENGSKG